MADPLDAWLYFLKNAEQLDSAALPPLLRRPGVERAVKELTMLTKEEHERYETRLKAQRDEVSRLRSAKLDGLEEGRAEGRAEALCNTILSLASSLGRPTQKQDLAKLSPAELQALHDRLLADVTAAISRAANGKPGA